MKQIRIPIDDLSKVLTNLSN